MTARRGRRATELEGVRHALYLIDTPIEHDEQTGISEGHTMVQEGLVLMASALCELTGRDLGAAPLDEVLAELGEDAELVETAAALIDALGQASYGHFASSEDAGTAEAHRQDLHIALEALEKKLAKEGKRA